VYPVQQPIYFVSEVLLESNTRYQLVQKLLYAALITSQKLRHYFPEVLDRRCWGIRDRVFRTQNHEIVVVKQARVWGINFETPKVI
jgi:hypothetical protein